MSASVGKTHPARRKPDLTCSPTVRSSRMFTPGIVAPLAKSRGRFVSRLTLLAKPGLYTQVPIQRYLVMSTLLTKSERGLIDAEFAAPSRGSLQSPPRGSSERLSDAAGLRRRVLA